MNFRRGNDTTVTSYMVIIFSNNYRLLIPADTVTIVWASSLVNTVHAISQTASNVKI